MNDTESLHDKLAKKELLDEFQEMLFALETGYVELLKWLEGHGIKSSLGALSRFKASHRGTWSMERAKREQQAFLEQHGADMDEATRRMTAVNIFNLSANPNLDTKSLLKMRDQEIKLAMLKHDAQRLAQAERKLAALEAQHEAARKALEGSAGTGGISDDTIKAVRQALGMSTEA